MVSDIIQTKPKRGHLHDGFLLVTLQMDSDLLLQMLRSSRLPNIWHCGYSADIWTLRLLGSPWKSPVIKAECLKWFNPNLLSGPESLGWLWNLEALHLSSQSGSTGDEQQEQTTRLPWSVLFLDCSFFFLINFKVSAQSDGFHYGVFHESLDFLIFLPPPLPSPPSSFLLLVS